MAKKETAVENKDGVVVKVDREKYTATRSASGSKSLNNGDPIAQCLDGCTLDELFIGAQKLTGEDYSEKYSKLNVGMQRMNVGNRIRGYIAKFDKEEKNEEGAGLAKLQKAFGAIRKAIDKRAADAEKAKAAKAKEAEKAKAAKAKAKADKKAKSAGK